MCFSPPKPPKVLPNPEVLRSQGEARAAAQTERAEAKRRRTEDNVTRLGGYGRTSLLRGDRGGLGFPTPMARSLFVPNSTVGNGLLR